MNVAEHLLLYDIDKIAKKLSDEFGSLSYDKFVADTSTIESAILRFLIMKEGWMSLPATMQQELLPIDWHAVTGRWDPQERRHVGFDPRKLWETIVQKLPELRKMTQELLKGKDQAGGPTMTSGRREDIPYLEGRVLSGNSAVDPRHGIDYETKAKEGGYEKGIGSSGFGDQSGSGELSVLSELAGNDSAARRFCQRSEIQV